jgi:hypothetical protein
MWYAAGAQKYEPAKGADQAHVHGPTQLALVINHFLQQGGVPQGNGRLLQNVVFAYKSS